MKGWLIPAELEEKGYQLELGSQENKPFFVPSRLLTMALYGIYP